MLDQQLPVGEYDYPDAAVARVVQPAITASLSADGQFVVGQNQARWSYTGVRTNLVRRSENLSVSPWVGSPATVLAAEVFAPGVSFWQLTKTASSISEYRGQVLENPIWPGSSHTTTVALLAASSDVASVGLYYNGSWGASGESTFAVVSGPGTATRTSGALIQVSGLDSVVPTLLRITRTATSYVAAPLLALYPGGHGSSTIGASAKFGRVQVELSGAYSGYIESGLSPKSVAVGRRLLVEPAGANWCNNSSWAGAAVGVNPGGLTIIGSGTGGAMTASIVGAGVEDGLPYIDVRYQGTPTTTGSQFTHSLSTAANYMPIVVGETATSSVFVRAVAGDISSVQFNLRHAVRDAAKAALATNDSPNLGITSPRLLAGRQVRSLLMTNASTGFVFLQLRVGVTTLTAQDFTLRYAVPQLEKGTAATSPVLTSSGAVTRPEDQVFVRAAFPRGAAAEARRINGGFYMVEAFFTQGTQRWTNWPLDVEWNGESYRGLGELGTVTELTESEGGVGGKVTLRLSPVAPGLLPMAMGNVESYRGKPVNVYFWPVDGNYRKVGQPILRHFGVMDQVSIKQDGDNGVIELTCLPGGTNGIRKSGGLRVSAAQQKLVDPLDRGLEYAPALVNNPQLWLSKQFQEI